MKHTFLHIQIGDTVTRMLAGTIPMSLVVTNVDDAFIHAAGEHGWKFRRDTGTEVDEDLGWDGITMTGSFLVDADGHNDWSKAP